MTPIEGPKISGMHSGGYEGHRPQFWLAVFVTLTLLLHPLVVNAMDNGQRLVTAKKIDLSAQTIEVLHDPVPIPTNIHGEKDDSWSTEEFGDAEEDVANPNSVDNVAINQEYSEDYDSGIEDATAYAAESDSGEAETVEMLVSDDPMPVDSSRGAPNRRPATNFDPPTDLPPLPPQKTNTAPVQNVKVNVSLAGVHEDEQLVGSRMPVGMVNEGNICYLNSIMQVFFNTPLIIRYLRRLPSDGTNGTINIMNMALTAYQASSEPVGFDSVVGDLYRRLQSNRKEHGQYTKGDPEEVFTKLTGSSDPLQGLFTFHVTYSIILPGTEDVYDLDDVDEMFYDDGATFVFDQETGEYMTVFEETPNVDKPVKEEKKMTEGKERKISEHMDHPSMWTVNLEGIQHARLDYLIGDASRVGEDITEFGDGAKKKLRAIDLPPVITISVKRAKATGAGTEFKAAVLDIPVELPFAAFANDDMHGSASLVAVICHIPSPAHYYTLLKSGNQWVKLNDEKASEVTLEEVLNIAKTEGHLLFYLNQLKHTITMSLPDNVAATFHPSSNSALSSSPSNSSSSDVMSSLSINKQEQLAGKVLSALLHLQVVAQNLIGASLTALVYADAEAEKERERVKEERRRKWAEQQERQRQQWATQAEQWRRQFDRGAQSPEGRGRTSIEVPRHHNHESEDDFKDYHWNAGRLVAGQSMYSQTEEDHLNKLSQQAIQQAEWWQEANKKAKDRREQYQQQQIAKEQQQPTQEVEEEPKSLEEKRQDVVETLAELKRTRDALVQLRNARILEAEKQKEEKEREEERRAADEAEEKKLREARAQRERQLRGEQIRREYAEMRAKASASSQPQLASTPQLQSTSSTNPNANIVNHSLGAIRNISVHSTAVQHFTEQERNRLLASFGRQQWNTIPGMPHSDFSLYPQLHPNTIVPQPYSHFVPVDNSVQINNPFRLQPTPSPLQSANQHQAARQESEYMRQQAKVGRRSSEDGDEVLEGSDVEDSDSGDGYTSIPPAKNHLSDNLREIRLDSDTVETDEEEDSLDAPMESSTDNGKSQEYSPGITYQAGVALDNRMAATDDFIRRTYGDQAAGQQQLNQLQQEKTAAPSKGNEQAN